LDRPLEQLFDLLGLGMVGEKLEEVVEVIDRHLKPLDRGGEVAGAESIAFLLVACCEVLDGEVDMTSLIHLMIFHALEEGLAQEEYGAIDLQFL
jgi:hypothetical protein